MKKLLSIALLGAAFSTGAAPSVPPLAPIAALDGGQVQVINTLALTGVS